MTNKKIVIGFAGHIGAGKDEAAMYLEKYLGFKHIKLAHPIQDIVAILGGFFTIDYSHRLKFLDREWKENTVIMTDNGGNPVTIRNLLKVIGTDLFRNQINTDIWASILAKYLDNSTQNIVISDVRYPNELDVIRNAKDTYGYLIYIDNAKARQCADTSHQSEQAQDFLKNKADFVVYNDPDSLSLSRFRYAIHEIVEDILGIDIHLMFKLE